MVDDFIIKLVINYYQLCSLFSIMVYSYIESFDSHFCLAFLTDFF